MKKSKIILILMILLMPVFIYADSLVDNPENLLPNIEKGNNNSLVLTWENDESVLEFQVYRSTKSTSGFKKIKTLNTNTFTDTKLTYGTTYYYKVVAVLAEGKATSNVISKRVVPNQVINVNAKPGNKQITISYSKTSNTGYEVYRSTDNVKWSKVKTITKSKTTSYKNTGLSVDKTYYYKVRAYSSVRGKKIYGAWSEVVSAKTAPGVPSFSVSVESYNSVIITEKKLPGEYYEIWRSTNKKKGFQKIRVGESHESPYYYTIDDEVKMNTTYYYKMRACYGEGICGSYTSVFSVRPGLKTTKLKAFAGTRSIEYTWNYVEDADGYELYLSKYKTKKYSKVSTQEYEDYVKYGLTPNKTYYAKVRSYKEIDGKKYYSSYSNIVKSKPYVKKAELKLKAQGNSVKVMYYNKDDYEDGINMLYQIYRATSKKGKYTLVATVDNDDYPYYNENLKENKTYYYKIRSFIKIGKKKYYGAYSNIVSVKTENKYPAEFKDVMAAVNNYMREDWIYSRHYLKSLLVDDYSEEEIAFAVEHIDIDWASAIFDYVENIYYYENQFYSKEQMIEILRNEEYTEEEIANVESYIEDAIEEMLSDIIYNDDYKYYSKAQLTQVLSDNGMDSDTINALFEEKDIDFNDVALNYAISMYMTNTREEIRQILTNALFTENEVNYVMESIEDLYNVNVQSNGTLSVGDTVTIGPLERYKVIETNESETKLLLDGTLLLDQEGYEENQMLPGTILWDDRWRDFNHIDAYNPIGNSELYNNIEFAASNYWRKPYTTDIYSSDANNTEPEFIYGDDEVNVSANDYRISYFVNRYVDTLKGLGAPNTITGRLLKYSELASLGCTRDECTNVPEWLFYVSYWLGTRDEDTEENILEMSNGFLSEGTYNGISGLRPVIIVNTDDILNENGIEFVSRSAETLITVGDELAIGTEGFYVISSNETNTVLLAKYNVLVGETITGSVNDEKESIDSHFTLTASDEGYGLQNSNADLFVSFGEDGFSITARGMVPFSGKPFWTASGVVEKYGNSFPANVYDENSTIYEHINNYVNRLNTLELFTNVSGRLMTYEEANNLKNSSKAYLLELGVEYWLGTAQSSNRVYMVDEEGKIIDMSVGYWGTIRPVIIVPTSELVNYMN